jgi:hypothetical protein
MSWLPSLPEIEPWPLAARLASAPAANPWTLVAVASDRVDLIAEELREQLASLLEAPVELVRVGSPDELLRSSHGPTGAQVLVGLDGLDAEAWRRVDVSRSRLSREQPAIIVLDERRLPLVVEHAPNLWSWLSGSAWRGALEDEPGDKARAQERA